MSLSAAPDPCNTGSWAQRWSCGWHQPATAASHAGYVFGEYLIPGLVVLGVLFAVIVASRKRRARRIFPARSAFTGKSTAPVRDGRVSSGARR
jgi:hypothetical protein